MQPNPLTMHCVHLLYKLSAVLSIFDAPHNRDQSFNALCYMREKKLQTDKQAPSQQTNYDVSSIRYSVRMESHLMSHTHNLADVPEEFIAFSWLARVSEQPACRWIGIAFFAARTLSTAFCRRNHNPGGSSNPMMLYNCEWI